MAEPPEAEAEFVGSFMAARGLPTPSRHDSELSLVLQRAWSEARRAWPRFAVSPHAFGRHVAARHDGTTAIVHAADLLLACGCDQGDPQAVAAFDRTVVEPLTGVLARITGDEAAAEDVKQELRARLVVPDASGARGISRFHGTGPLRKWTEITAIRLAHRRKQAHRPVADETDQMWTALAGPHAPPDAELEAFAQMYRSAFRTAFAEAVASLDRRSRNLLRHQLVDGLSVDQIARVYHISRATTTRHLAAARQHVVDRTRSAFASHAGVSQDPRKLQSLLRLVRSGLHLSLTRMLTGKARER